MLSKSKTLAATVLILTSLPIYSNQEITVDFSAAVALEASRAVYGDPLQDIQRADLDQGEAAPFAGVLLSDEALATLQESHAAQERIIAAQNAQVASLAASLEEEQGKVAILEAGGGGSNGILVGMGIAACGVAVGLGAARLASDTVVVAPVAIPIR